MTLYLSKFMLQQAYAFTYANLKYLRGLRILRRRVDCDQRKPVTNIELSEGIGGDASSEWVTYSLKQIPVRWCTCIIPALGRQREENLLFGAFDAVCSNNNDNNNNNTKYLKGEAAEPKHSLKFITSGGY